MSAPADLPEALALLNACLNATAGVLLLRAYRAIRRRDVAAHRAQMLAAFATSALFLVSYLTRIAIAGDRKYGGPEWLRPFYLTILVSHVVLALTVVPLALRTLYLAWKTRYAEHRRIARVTFPIWMYVSVTGVVVYLLLYQVS